MTSNDFKVTLEWPKNNHVDPKSVFVLWDDIRNKVDQIWRKVFQQMADILIMPESIGEFQLFSLLLKPKLPKTLKQAPTVDWFLSNWS